MKPLKTLKGSRIWYSKFGVGKQVGSKVYMHKDYALDIVPTDVLWNAQDILRKYEPGASFNCICYDLKNPNVIRFDEAPRFDTDREPYPGIMYTVDVSRIDEGERCYKVSYSDAIWHHKWLWVANDYKGFDVRESYEWSRHWLSKLGEVASGYPHKWTEQLNKYNVI
jgi:hypothetical protein